MTQVDVAKSFGVHPNTVFNIVSAVRSCDIEDNPLALDWKSGVIRKAQRAVDNLLELKSDPVAAGNAGLKVLYGTGELVSGSQIAVKGDIALTVSWLPMQPTDQAQITSAEPVAIDAEYDIPT